MRILKSVYKIFDVIYDEAEKEWMDEEKHMNALNELFQKLSSGEISEEEYEEEEDKIMDRLKEIRAYKKINNIQ